MISTLIARTRIIRTNVHAVTYLIPCRQYHLLPQRPALGNQTMSPLSSCLPWNKSSSNRTISNFPDDHHEHRRQIDEKPRHLSSRSSLYTTASSLAPAAPPAYQEKPSTFNPDRHQMSFPDHNQSRRGFTTSAFNLNHGEEPHNPAYALGLPVDEAKARLRGLQRLLVDHKLDYYIIPTADEHQSEWTSKTDQRREYITGFNGSAGTALVRRQSASSNGNPMANADVGGIAATEASAWLFVDNRYWIQAESQTSAELWNVVRLVPRDSGKGWVAVWDWAKENLEEGARVGIDPKLIDWPTAQSVQKSLRPRNISLLGITENLIDTVRNPDVPVQTKALVEDHPLIFSGRSVQDKLKDIRRVLFHDNDAKDGVKLKSSSDDDTPRGGIYVLPVLPAIAWLLNLRCQGDIPNVPVFRSYLALTSTRCALFIDQEKLTIEVRDKLKRDDVEVRDYGVDEVKRWVWEHRIRVREERGEKALEREGKVLVPTSASWGLADSIGLENVKTIDCPVDKAKAIKNSTEIEGFRRAYLRDGAATVRWLTWLEEQVKDKKKDIGECEAGDKLSWFRSFEQYYRGLAYENISASGPNGALPHYIPVKGQDRVIDRKTTYVIDAGGQYLDGTIDTTRTLHFGTPTADQMRASTRVLQGHIAIETTPFPSGTKGDKLDPLARQFLWKEGLSFGHGVGHGIGSYLSVHELPPGIGWATTIEPGHIVSNEPGFYLEGEWGIRIESVVVCKEIDTKYNFGTAPWLGWERVTRVPIQTSLVDFSLLSKEEAQWLEDHNAQVIAEVMPLLNRTGDENARKWLKKQAL